MVNININVYIYHVCEVPVIFCQRSVKWKLTPGILRRKSLVSTDTVCNEFVRQS